MACMPRYFFSISNKIKIPDTVGMLLPDGLAARAHASSLVNRIANGVTKSILPLTVTVTNDEDENVFEMSTPKNPSEAAAGPSKN
jgi:hypothetical protein